MSWFDDARLTRYDAAWRAELSTDGVSLAVFRVLFVFYLLLGGAPSYSWLAEVPQSFFFPPRLSLAALADQFPSRGTLALLDAVVALSLLAILVGLKTRWFTAVLLTSMIIGNSFSYSFGKIDHGIFREAVLLVMLFVDWGQCLSLDSKIKGHEAHAERPSLLPLAVIFAACFLTAGLPKAATWIDFDATQNGFLDWLYNGYYNQDRQFLLAPLVVKMRPSWLFEFADYAAVLFELSGLVAVFKRRWMLVWLMSAGGFHLVNCLVLNIPFEVNAFCYLAFVPWSALLSRVRSLEAKLVQMLGALFFLACLVVLARMSGKLPAPTTPETLTLAALLWCGVIALFAWTLYTERKRGRNPAVLAASPAAVEVPK